MAEVQIKFSQIDPTAKGDLLPGVGGISTTPFIAQLDAAISREHLRYDDRLPPGNYGTLEHNFLILDGSMVEFPSSPHVPATRTWGFWNSSQSDANGNFSVIPSITFTFGNLHKSNGLTIYFYSDTDDYAKTVRITWKGA